MTDLLAKLNNDPDATEADVLAYLGQRLLEGELDGLTLLSVDEFWAEGDMDKYRALRDWWPTDAPPFLGRPYLGVLCRGIAGHPSMPRPLPFADELTRMWQRACGWLETEGRSLVNPNESKEERRRRKTREAVARHRKLATSEDPRATEVKRLHAEYIEACQRRKAAAALHDQDVADAHARWERAKADLGVAS